MKHQLIGVATLMISVGVAYICFHGVPAWMRSGDQADNAKLLGVAGLFLPLTIVSGVGHLAWGQRFETMMQGEPSPERNQRSWMSKLTPIGRKIVLGSLLLGVVLYAGLVMSSHSSVAVG